ncbi:MAG: iron-containing alcohol dehydrogenase, partial [Planctomycetaceae bacterium]|nr:iron-containing alcohol dehydrogenase [Planctomycetaceae bacterium]
GPALKRLGRERVLIITDAPLVSAGIVERVTQALPISDFRVSIFDEGEPEPSLEVASRAVEAARRFSPDAILGLGGGSNMDLAKITSIVHTHGGDFGDYFGWNNVPGPVCPIIGVPTTAGTGSEVSQAAVLSDRANQIKVSTLSPYLRPALAVVDPELTFTCPRTATADSGIDALTHAIEAYIATHSGDLDVPPGEITAYEGKNPLADCFAERAIELIGQHLETAVNQPTNAAAREGMSLAATLAGMAFSSGGVALVHAMEYPLGGVLHCSHGAGNGLLLPYVMRFNLPVRTTEISRIAQLLGEDVSDLDEPAAAERAIVAVERLRDQIGIPKRIHELGGRAEQLPEFAQKAFAIKRLMALTPRDPSEAEILAIYQDAL